MYNGHQVSTAILSVTAKAQAKSKKKEESVPPAEPMEVYYFVLCSYVSTQSKG